MRRSVSSNHISKASASILTACAATWRRGNFCWRKIRLGLWAAFTSSCAETAGMWVCLELILRGRAVDWDEGSWTPRKIIFGRLAAVPSTCGSSARERRFLLFTATSAMPKLELRKSRRMFRSKSPAISSTCPNCSGKASPSSPLSQGTILHGMRPNVARAGQAPPLRMPIRVRSRGTVHLFYAFQLRPGSGKIVRSFRGKLCFVALQSHPSCSPVSR